MRMRCAAPPARGTGMMSVRMRVPIPVLSDRFAELQPSLSPDRAPIRTSAHDSAALCLLLARLTCATNLCLLQLKTAIFVCPCLPWSLQPREA